MYYVCGLMKRKIFGKIFQQGVFFFFFLLNERCRTSVLCPAQVLFSHDCVLSFHEFVQVQYRVLFFNMNIVPFHVLLCFKGKTLG